MTVEKLCNNCQKSFTIRLAESTRGGGKFCSLSCSAIHGNKTRKLSKIPNVVCSYCQKPVYKNKSKLSKSKHHIYFCCRNHKDLGQRIGGVEQIQPFHYGSPEPKSSYRTFALRNFPNECVYCRYNRYIEVLDVHHKDGNRQNNKLENLEITCPTCHTEQHFLKKSGRFTGNTKR